MQEEAEGDVRNLGCLLEIKTLAEVFKRSKQTIGDIQT